MKKVLVCVVLILCLWICRSFLFNLVVSYNPSQELPTVKLKSNYWIGILDSITVEHSYRDIRQINNLILEVISRHIDFGSDQKSNDPNSFADGSIAHCVGYASLNASLLQHLLQTMKIVDYEIKHVRGDVTCFGTVLTGLSSSSFWKDHDFIKITNVKTGECFYSDASLNNFVNIDVIES